MFLQERKKKYQNGRLQRTSPASTLDAVKAAVPTRVKARIHFWLDLICH